MKPITEVEVFYITEKTAAELREKGIDPTDPAMSPIPGARVEIVPNDYRPPADDPVILVCKREGEPSEYTDNVRGRCMSCGHGIYHRPHAVGTVRVCVPCAMDPERMAELDGPKGVPN